MVNTSWMDSCITKYCQTRRNLILRASSFIAGIFSALAGLVGFAVSVSFHAILIYFFLIACGGLIIFLEFKRPQAITRQIQFYEYTWGRSAAYFLLGAVSLDRGIALTVIGFLILVTSFVYFLIFLNNVIFKKNESKIWLIPPPLVQKQQPAKAEDDVEEPASDDKPATSVAVPSDPVQPASKPSKMKSECLFFPDACMPCRKFMATGHCRYGDQCKYSHQETNLVKFLKTLRQATTSINIAIYTISCDEIANLLVDLHQKGVKIQLITDNKSIENRGSDVLRLQDEGIACKCDRSDEDLMHHKFAVIDSKIVLNGSFNWTMGAVLHNNENVMIIQDSRIAELFNEEFHKMWDKYPDVVVGESGV